MNRTRRPLSRSRPARTFCLVHGTWHGGWVWRRVADLLEQAGHRVITPTATGCGERAHLIGPDVTLSTHVADVVGAIEAEELDRVILVGHSFGGLTITGVADALGSRIARIVFYDAFVPTRARPAWVMRDAQGNWPAWWQERTARFEAGYKMSFFDFYPLEMLVPAEDGANTALLRRRLTWHPAGQWTEPVSFARGGWEPLPRTYIHTTAQTFRPSSEAMWGPARSPGWDWQELPTPRDGMLTHPRLVAGALMALV
jgi:pimeloyl-ACP methyl ester carboxylesterase